MPLSSLRAAGDEVASCRGQSEPIMGGAMQIAMIIQVRGESPTGVRGACREQA